VASEEEGLPREGDKRQDTSSEASSEADSMDTGGEDRDDKRQDHPSEAWQ